jgi:phosphopantothenate---cysteine ligase (CTP)
MTCVVTAGPTCEPLDQVRRMSNLSTGRLGVRLADSLVDRGCQVILLRGSAGTYGAESRAQRVEWFFTTAELESLLAATAGRGVGVVFHAAAVSDFRFGRIFERSAAGDLIERVEGKLSTAHGDLLVELRPTPKLIGRLRGWFPSALIAGWKYEVDGSRQSAVRQARDQMLRHDTDLCVVNGPAYGAGYGVVTADDPAALRTYVDADSLYTGLWERVAGHPRPSSSGNV